MAVTATPYGSILITLGYGLIDLPADSLYVMLTTSGYVPDMDAHTQLSDVTSEVTGDGYTTLGQPLQNVHLDYDSTNHWAVLSADSVTWTGATFTAHFAVVYKYTGDPTSSPLIGFLDFGLDQTFSAEDFQLSFPNGVLRIKAG